MPLIAFGIMLSKHLAEARLDSPRDTQLGADWAELLKSIGLNAEFSSEIPQVELLDALYIIFLKPHKSTRGPCHLSKSLEFTINKYDDNDIRKWHK
jgi:hypothetical protein